MKKLMSILLAITLIIGVTPMSITMASESTTDNETKEENLNDSEESVTNVSENPTGYKNLNINNIEESELADVSSKNEIIYGILNTDGSVSEIYVVNEFDVTEAGIVNDFGNYDTILNLSSTEEIKNENDELSMMADEGKFYYQGDITSKELPWNISIKYYLDGQEISSEDLAGEYGELEIKISTRKNEAVKAEYFENYMLQIAVTLDENKCKNIESEGATIASAGASKMINVTAMPEKDTDIVISATVKDFEMSGISISALPLSMSIDLPDSDETTDGIDELTDGIDELADGTIELSDGTTELKDGSTEIIDGIVELSDGSLEFSDGLDELYDGAQELTDGSAQILDGLREMNDGLQDSDMNIDLEPLTKLPAQLKKLADPLTFIADGLRSLEEKLVLLASSLPDTDSITSGEMTAMETALSSTATIASSSEKGPTSSEKNVALEARNFSVPASTPSDYDGKDTDTPPSDSNSGATDTPPSDSNNGATDTPPSNSNDEKSTVTPTTKTGKIFDTYSLAIEPEDSLSKNFEELKGFYDAAVIIKQAIGGTDASAPEVQDAPPAPLPTPTISQTLIGLADNTTSIYEGLMLMSSELEKSLGSLDLSGLDGIDDLADGVDTLTSEYATFHQGLIDYNDGVITATDSYILLDDGINEFGTKYTEFDDGVIELQDGVIELNDGVAELQDGTKDMSSDIEEMMDDMTSEYDKSDYIATSFVSDKSSNPDTVQFVLKTDEIKSEEVVEVIEIVEDQRTMWERFLDLFI